jgi:hypothetical protein
MRGLRLGLGLTKPSSGGAAVTPVVFVTSNGANKSSNITLSNGNLTATGNNAVNGYQCVRANAAKTGKRQAEVTMSAFNQFGPAIYFGVDDSSFSLASDGSSAAVAPGVTGITLVLSNSAYKIIKNGSQTQGSSLTQPVAGDVLTLEYDSVGGTVSFYSSRSGQIGATETGVSLATWTAYAGADNNNAVTANFGGSAFSHALGSGYSSYQS